MDPGQPHLLSPDFAQRVPQGRAWAFSLQDMFIGDEMISLQYISKSMDNTYLGSQSQQLEQQQAQPVAEPARSLLGIHQHVRRCSGCVPVPDHVTIHDTRILRNLWQRMCM